MNELLDYSVDTIIYGGLGTDEKCLERAANNLSKKIGMQVTGITCRNGLASPDLVAELADKRNVIVYSCGGTILSEAVLSQGSRPITVNYAAAPDKTTMYAAANGFMRSAFTRSSVGSNLEPQTMFAMAKGFIHETVKHPIDNIELIKRAVRFEQLAAAVAVQEVVERVAIITPEADEIFSPYVFDQYGGDYEYGVKYIVVPGGHRRFASDAGGMLYDAEKSNPVIVNQRTLQEGMFRPMRKAPTFDESVVARRARGVRDFVSSHVKVPDLA